jgi:1-deoxy-D-xylulose-5-phosphate reductoisomerase
LKKRIAILGSTGSIGTQALEVIKGQPAGISVEVLAAYNNADLLIAQAKEFMPNSVVIVNEAHYQKVFSALNSYDIKVFAGEDSLEQIVESDSIDMVLASVVGFAGLRSTLNAVRHGKTIALANKETLVVAGDLITRTAKENGVNIYPVDSEHSAVFQCLSGEFHNAIEKIYLTASGGPFRGKSMDYLKNVSPADALAHPRWKMGHKISIDSATLMNKGLEVIEAKWLFGLNPQQIEVVIHPQAIIHSMVQFSDGSVKAQMGLPDMKNPILYAFSYPKRLQTDYPRLDFTTCNQLTFEKPDTAAFRCLNIAYNALEQGGNMPCVMNAANEMAVQAFLEGKAEFLQIADIVETAMLKVKYIAEPLIQDYFDTDKETRFITDSIIKKIK